MSGHEDVTVHEHKDGRGHTEEAACGCKAVVRIRRQPKEVLRRPGYDALASVRRIFCDEHGTLR